MASLFTIIREVRNDPCWGKKTPHWLPERDMKSLQGKVTLITGPTAGIGYETARQLVLSGAKVYLFGRNVAKLEKTRDTLQQECAQALGADTLSDGQPRFGGSVGEMVLVQCDLSSLQGIKKAAEEFLAKEDRLDLFFGNAGLITEGKTQDGYELMLGTNTLGHHALVRLLLPALKRAAEASAGSGEVRVVLTSSGAHRFVDKPIHVSPEGLDDYRKGKLSNSTHLYGRSKMGNIYTAQKLASLSSASGDGIISCAVHPGAIQSDLGGSNAITAKFKKMILYPASLGAVTQLWGAVGAEKDEVNGKYLVPYARVGELNELGNDTEARDKLWKWCEEQCLKHGLIDQILV